MGIYAVTLSRQAEKDLKRVPSHVVMKLAFWIDDVAERGLREVRKVLGYHDEPLKGKRYGQRSIRLSRAYRAFYKINSDGEIEFIEVLEVNKHVY